MCGLCATAPRCRGRWRVRHAADDGFGFGEAGAFAALVGVPDGGDPCGLGSFDVARRVADENALLGAGVQLLDGGEDWCRVGLHLVRLALGVADDRVYVVGEASGGGP